MIYNTRVHLTNETHFLLLSSVQYIPVSRAESHTFSLPRNVKHWWLAAWPQQPAVYFPSFYSTGPWGQWRIPQPQWRQQHRKPARCYDASGHWELTGWVMLWFKILHSPSSRLNHSLVYTKMKQKQFRSRDSVLYTSPHTNKKEKSFFWDYYSIMTFYSHGSSTKALNYSH